MIQLKARIARGAAWLVLLRFVERVIGLISTILLARLLVPEDFGVMVMAMSVYAGLEVMTAFSFDLALIQNRNANRTHYDTAWTFNVVFGAAVFVGLLGLALPTASFYADERVAPVMMALGIAAFVRGFENIGVVEFQRDLNLVQEFKIGLARKIAGFVVTIGIAWVWPTYWALVFGIMAQRLVSLWLTFLLHPYRPRLSLAAKDELLGCGKWLALNNVAIFLSNRINDFIVGRIAGPAALGAYNISYEVANLPTTELVFPVSRALFPGLASIAQDKNQIRVIYLQVLALIGWLAMPISVGMIVLAEPVVMVLLGEKWRSAIPLLQILAAHGALRTLTANCGSVYLAVGSPRTIMKMTLLFLAILLPASIFGTTQFGATGAAGAVLFAAALQFLVLAKSIAALLSFGWLRYLEALWRPALGCAFMAWALTLLDAYLAAIGAAFLTRLAVGSLGGGIFYLFSVGTLWAITGRKSGPETYFLSIANRARTPVTGHR